ncbi:MAG: N-acetyltransferase [Planctomycetota bacterium]|nr:MAG: N-acetyltransferase [Planctomycetota bacterium]
MSELVLVSPADCLDLRSRILRPGQPLKACNYPGDADPRCLNAAVRLEDDGPLVAIGTLHHDPRDTDDASSEVWRIRGMAVEESCRRQGLGAQVLKTLQAVAEARGGGVWANVRTPAREFYAAHGFVAQGEEYELPGIGPHVLMTWRPAP